MGLGGLPRWSRSPAELRRDGPWPPGCRLSAARWCGSLGAPNLPRNPDLRRVTRRPALLRRRCPPRCTTRTSSGKYFSASRRARHRSRAPVPSASSGAASSPTPGSSGASAPTTGSPPLLGLFSHNRGKIGFTPLLDPPDRIPAGRFSLRLQRGSRVYGCRHGRVLVVNGKPLSFLVWDPVSGNQCRVPFPSASGGNNYMIDGAIMCAGGGQGHAHGACHSSPFLVVFLGHCGDQIIAWVYSSETGTWGDAISIMWLNPFNPDDFDCCNTLVGNSIYWLFNESSMAILEFDLPQEVIDLNTSVRDKCQFLIMPADGGGLGVLILEGFNARIWKRTAKCDGDTGWVLRNTIELDLQLKPWARRCPSEIIGFAEDYNVVFISTGGGVVTMVHLESGQFKKLPQKLGYRMCYPFTSFCTAGPATVFSSVPPARSEEDLLTHIEVVKDRELNLMFEDGEVDRWDPMIHEANMPPISVLSLHDANGRGS